MVSKKIPVPVSISPSRNYYLDNLVDEDISINVQDTVKEIIENRNIGYQLKVPREIKKTFTVTKKIPVIVKEPLKNTLYEAISVIQSNEIGTGVFIDYTFNDESNCGIEYGRFKSGGYLSLKY